MVFGSIRQRIKNMNFIVATCILKINHNMASIANEEYSHQSLCCFALLCFHDVLLNKNNANKVVNRLWRRCVISYLPRGRKLFPAYNATH